LKVLFQFEQLGVPAVRQIRLYTSYSRDSEAIEKWLRERDPFLTSEISKIKEVLEKILKVKSEWDVFSYQKLSVEAITLCSQMGVTFC
jgi:hypothetical protein